jgi:hypothetical protein
MFRNTILPLISLVSGLVCLYIDPKKDKGKAWIVIAVLSASAIATGAYGYIDNRDSARQVQQADDKLSRQLTVAESTKQETDLIVAALRAQGILSTTTGKVSQHQLQQSLAADLARKQELQLRSQNPPSQQSTIEYFSRDLDKDIVSQALKEGGA